MMIRDNGDFFAHVNRAALNNSAAVIHRLLPNGKIQGNEYAALNPKRADERIGSFKVNMTTGRWADFATGDKGGDLISLTAYLHGMSQIQAARRLADMLGVSHG